MSRDPMKRFDDETKAAKSFAYGLARDLNQQAAERAKSKQASKQSS